MLNGDQPVLPPNAATQANKDFGLELYSYGESLCSQKIRTALAEKQLPYISHHIYICDVAQNCKNLSPEYLEINPKGIVPTLIHNGEKVFDAHMMIRYLDEQFPEHGEKLWPTDPEKTEFAEYWFEHGMLPDVRGERPNFASAIASFSLQLLEHMLKRQPLDHVIEKYKKHPLPERGAMFTALRKGERRLPQLAMDVVMDVLVDGLLGIERQLEKTVGPYILGEFSMVDITLMACLHRMEDIHLDGLLSQEALPELNSYWQRLQARPSYKAAILDWHDEENWRSAIIEIYGDQPSPHLGLLQQKLAEKAA